MGYFSNSSEGMSYETRYCYNCIHCPKTTNCAIWEMHQLHNYEQFKKPDVKTLMNYFIPVTDEGTNGKCRMFIKNNDCDGQGKLF